MDLQNSALIVIDLQAGIKTIAGKAYPISFDEVLENNRQLIEVFAESNARIYLVTVQPKALPAPARRAFGKLLLHETSERYPQVHQLIKFGPSAFSESDYGLEKELKELGIEKVFITGVSTSNGVLKTAQDAKAAGLEVAIIEGATADKSQEKYKEALENDILKIGSLVKVSDFLSMKEDEKNDEM